MKGILPVSAQHFAIIGRISFIMYCRITTWMPHSNIKNNFLLFLIYKVEILK
jgi:hypothetical protein